MEKEMERVKTLLDKINMACVRGKLSEKAYMAFLDSLVERHFPQRYVQIKS